MGRLAEYSQLLLCSWC